LRNNKIYIKDGYIYNKTIIMKNVQKLRNELVKVFNGVKDGSIDTTQGKTLVATSNAMLKSAQLELEHSKLTGEIKKIDFLRTE